MVKRYFILVVYILAAAFFNRAKAQSSPIMISAHSFPSPGYCNLPYYFGISLQVYGAADSGRITINYGDGTIDSFNILIPFNTVPSTVPWPVNFEHRYRMFGKYNPLVTVVSKSGSSDTYLPAPFEIIDTCANLKGRLYIDDNKNCIPDAGEAKLKSVMLRFIRKSVPDTFYTSRFTDTSGQYTADLYPGFYEVTPVIGIAAAGFSSDSLSSFCPVGKTDTITVTSATSYVRNFGYTCNPADSFDAGILTTVNGYVPGDTSVLTVSAGTFSDYAHYSCIARTSAVTVTLDPGLTYAGIVSGKFPSSVSGSLITWNLSGTEIADFRSSIKVVTDTSKHIGDTICCSSYIAPAPGYPDPNLSNNFHYYCSPVHSSFDPNTKEVTPAGRGPEGYVPANQPLVYTVHFQNTGTARAKNVIIVDQLDHNADELSVVVLNSSHNHHLYRYGKELHFQFTGINLPDSGSNYYGSMGSVTYAILPVRDLAPGTEIRNTAAIYFDYNAPVITNTTLNTIETTTGLQHISAGNLNASIFPNPANSQLTVKLDNNAAFTVTVTDMLGRIAATEYNTGSVVITTSQLPAGMYLIQVADKLGNTLNAKVIVKH